MREKKEVLEVTKWSLSGNQSRILKERQHNGQKKMAKRTNSD